MNQSDFPNNPNHTVNNPNRQADGGKLSAQLVAVT